MIVCLIAGLLFNYTKLHQNVQKYMQDEYIHNIFQTYKLVQ